MLLLPFDKLIINSTCTHDEVLNKLIEVIGKPKMNHGKGWWVKEYPKDMKPYAGSLTRSKVSIYRVLTNYRSSFNPLITGRIIPKSTGTQVKLHFYLHPIVIIFMAAWLVWAGLSFKATMHNAIHKGELNGLGFSLALFLGGYLLMMLPYKHEVRKSKRFFHSLFQSNKAG